MLNNSDIKKIISTPKSEEQRKNNNVYTFYVDQSINKFQLKILLEKTFDVVVEKICSLRKKPVLRNSRKKTYTKLQKKAFVKLKPGYKIGKQSEEVSQEQNLITSSQHE